MSKDKTKTPGQLFAESIKEEQSLKDKKKFDKSLEEATKKETVICDVHVVMLETDKENVSQMLAQLIGSSENLINVVLALVENIAKGMGLPKELVFLKLMADFAEGEEDNDNE